MPSVNLDEVYILATGQSGPCWTWKNSPSGFHSKQQHPSYSQAMQAQGYSQGVIYHTLDPISAIVLGLITVDELRGFYPSGFTALLDMLKH